MILVPDPPDTCTHLWCGTICHAPTNVRTWRFQELDGLCGPIVQGQAAREHV